MFVAMNLLDFSPIEINDLIHTRLSILPQQLFLAKITKEQLQQKLYSFLHLVFLTENSTNFLSYTATNDAVSLILDKASLEHLGSSDGFVVSKQYYRAIQIYEGEDAIEQPGYIHQFTLPMTKAGIPIIYLSTFHTDIILVEEDKLDRAYRILQDLFPKVLPLESTMKTTKISSKYSNSNNSNQSQMSHGGNAKTLELTQLPNTLSLVSFPRNRIPDFSFCLLKLLLSPQSSEDEYFFSATLTSDEVSLIVETTLLEQLPSKFVVEFQRNSKSWKAIQISAGMFGFAGLGAVSKISEILANHNISIYYLSTFDDDFILVQENDIVEAINCLQKEEISRQHQSRYLETKNNETKETQ